jgi:hypothetical protein
MMRLGPKSRWICPESTSKSACRRPKANSLAKGEGADDRDDLIKEVHATLRVRMVAWATKERGSHMMLPLLGAPTVVGSIPNNNLVV